MHPNAENASVAHFKTGECEQNERNIHLRKSKTHALFNVRWPNTVFARALADAIQRAYKDCKNKHAVDTAIIFLAQCPLYLCYFLRT